MLERNKVDTEPPAAVGVTASDRKIDQSPASPAAPSQPQSKPAKKTNSKVIRQYELVELVRAYDPEVDEEALNRAYVFAMRAHGSQLRASGDPYFHHPVEVAGILTRLKLDSATIITALLHDVVEDTGTTLDEIQKLFGHSVARLVDGVTKLNKLELQSADTAQAENFRKLLLAMSEDIRVLLVKLADRLHNMRTLHFIKKPEKRERIARETMEIYAPLAERIGMDRLRAELEDLAFGELFPDAKESIMHRLLQLRRDDVDLIERIISALHGALREAGIEAEIQGREKSPWSIWRKMQRKNVGFEQLSDIMAFRVMVDDEPNCYAALGQIHASFAMLPGRFKDFISTPKPNGYRSIHTTIIGPEQRKIEVQIKTAMMQEVAEFGVAAHWAYKDDAKVTEGRQYRWIRELLDILEHASEPNEFLEHTKLEMFQDQVFCFTPKGELYSLPQGATPVDFAYAVHSEIGDHCVGCRVDGRMVQLRTELHNGDQVEIITSRNAEPSTSWERFVVTGKARARIRRFMRLKKRKQSIEQGRTTLLKLGRSANITVGDKVVDKVAGEFNLRAADDVYASIGDGLISARSVLGAIAPQIRERLSPNDGQSDDEIVAQINKSAANRPAPSQSMVGPIEGVPEGIDVQFARCCHPIPGDPIIGLIRTGKPLAIHLAKCSNITSQRAEKESRLIDVAWRTGSNVMPATARIAVVVQDHPGSLGNISTSIGSLDGNITDIKITNRSNDFCEIIIDLEVANREKLNQVLAVLRAKREVGSVERI